MERDRQAKWDGENMATVSTKMRRREYLQPKAMCVARGTTPYALLQSMIRSWMVADDGKD